MGFFGNLFKKNKKIYKIDQKQEDSLAVMLDLKKKLKLGSKIYVPNNFCAVVFSKEHLLDEIPAGTHELNGLTISKACKKNKLDKPTKKGYKEEMNADFYYVNLNAFKLQAEFFIKRLKFNVNYIVYLKIVNVKRFLKFLISDRVVFKDDFAQKYLRQIITDLTYYFILDNKVLEEEKLKNYLSKKLLSVGVEILEFQFKHSIRTDAIKLDEEQKTSTTNNVQTTQQQSMFNVTEQEKVLDEIKKEKTFNMKEDDEKNYINYNIEERDVNSMNEYVEPVDGGERKKSSLVNLDEIGGERVTYFICEDCGAYLPETSLSCYKCGKSFVEKHCCEACGKEIPLNTYVCPYCNSVIL